MKTVFINSKEDEITLLNSTIVSDYILLFFDADLVFKGASYSIKSSTIQTQYKNILFLKLPHTLRLSLVNNLSR